MEAYYNKLLTLSFAGTLLSACATEGGPGAVKQNEYMAQGCVAGGLVGALIGANMGDDDDGTAKGALFGCAAGAAIGFSIAERTGQYISANQATDSETKRNQENTAKLKNYNSSLQSTIASYESQINAARNQNIEAAEKMARLKKIKSTVAKQAQEAERSLSSVNAELAVAKQQVVKYKKETKPADSSRWEGEVAALEKERDILNGHVQSLNAMNSSI